MACCALGSNLRAFNPWPPGWENPAPSPDGSPAKKLYVCELFLCNLLGPLQESFGPEITKKSRKVLNAQPRTQNRPTHSEPYKSQQPPGRNAEWNFYVFHCQGCRQVCSELLVQFSACYVFHGLGVWIGKSLKILTSLNKEVRPFFLGDNSIWSFPSVYSLSDYSIWRFRSLFYLCDHSIWSIWVHCPQILSSLRKSWTRGV